jgi:cell division protein FtsB
LADLSERQKSRLEQKEEEIEELSKEVGHLTHIAKLMDEEHKKMLAQIAQVKLGIIA